MTDHRNNRLRGRNPIPDNEKKSRVVGVRLTPDDLQTIDFARGNMSRAELLRGALMHNLPRPIPEINLETHRLLGKALGNLAAVATISRRGGYVQEIELLPLLREVRMLLISSKKDLEEEEGE
jgi:hypothetical protein